ncbi:hypothetical protein AVEN_240584-1 [Araneus ventricosus]|uniref:CCHC-type domain-containing protein n=1 Tax=Araneus ventricosus TaxID=182803 RepID=A0A4Y2H405_ARAVE|nr:hypothetical protein AVEN_240584-1 [Araneus ventricosus]
MFIKHSKNADGTWKDSMYELRTYFQEWIKGLEVETFELCDLIITDQMKHRVSKEIKEHFIDEWPKFKSPEELSNKLDQYESVQNVMKRKTSFHDHNDKYYSYKEKEQASARGVTKKKQIGKIERVLKNMKFDKGFELKKEFRCYHCACTGNFRSNCPQLKQSESTALLNLVISVPDNDLMSPYTIICEVNGFKMLILHDTGPTVDSVSRNRIRSLTRNLSTGLWQK